MPERRAARRGHPGSGDIGRVRIDCGWSTASSGAGADPDLAGRMMLHADEHAGEAGDRVFGLRHASSFRLPSDDPAGLQIEPAEQHRQLDGIKHDVVGAGRDATT